MKQPTFKTEQSYGIIPLRRLDEQWQVLIVRHKAGHWSFPKGHANLGETSQETALRELFEETGLTVHRFLLKEPLQEHYFFTRDRIKIDKKVDYFVAEVRGEARPQLEEIAEIRWILLSEAGTLLTFPESKRMCLEVLDQLR